MSDATPAWAYERLVICAYDPGWADRAGAERERLTELLAPWLTGAVEHVGSTAVPGLAAKPVVDLMAPVRDLAQLDGPAAERLTADGWCYVPPELDERSWRRLFVRPDPAGQHRIAHLHVIPDGHPRWEQQLAFRDALRDDAGLAGRYADLKRALASEHGDDREAYSAGKAEFVAAVLQR
jgi:GrpB-like predicted nucleotidyltransferase (UPF0157 family)